MVILLGITVSGGAGEAASNPGSSAFPGDRELLELIATQVEAGRAPGIVLGVMDADGSSRVVSYGSAGSGAKPLGPQSVFEIGSITKVFTASVLAAMNAIGRVQLDDPVQKHVPSGLAMPEMNGRAITLSDLAEQNSGLPANFSPIDSDHPFGGYSTADLSAFLSTYPLTRAPGERFEYSNLGVGLLGLALANREGLSYEALVRKYVLKPLDMRSTGVRLTAAMNEAAVVGHDLQKRAVAPSRASAPFEGAGALRSSLQDLMKFLAANLRAPRTELERAMRFAQQPRADAGSDRIGLNWLSRTTSGGVHVVYHAGSTGGFSSFIGFDAKRRVGVVMLANQIGVPNEVPFHLLDSTLAIRPPPPDPKALGAITLSTEQSAKFAGVFVVDAPPNMKLNVTIEDGMMFVATAGVGKVPFYPDSPTTAFSTFVNARISLVTGSNGAVAGLVLRMGGKDQAATKIN